MAGVSPWHIPGTIAKPKPLQNPWNIPNTSGNNVVTGLAAPATGYQPPAPPPAAPPAPVDYNALINADAGYTTQNADNARQNQLAMQRLLQNFRGTAQSYQDQANAHGALFSGAAVNAQRSAAQGYSDQAAQQAANYAQNQNTIHTSAWQRLLNQLAGGA